MNRYVLFVVIVIFFSIKISFGENNNPKTDSSKDPKFFGKIYTGFYYNSSNNVKPRTAFELSTGILGLSHKISDNIRATIVYDVTRTTNIFSATDSQSGNVHIDYFEGSKYTAFLKMAQIDWTLNKYFQLSVGQLLGQQYLTVQDKWWGFRYMRVTYQEAYRYGNPADFGARLSFKLGRKLKISSTVVNGEGPFRHQDTTGHYRYAQNIEFTPIKNIMAKFYFDILPLPGAEKLSDNRMAYSAFLAYKTKSIMLGFEYNKVKNYTPGISLDGISVYGSYKFYPKWTAVLRADIGDLAVGLENEKYLIAGIQYEAGKYFYTSVNIRHNGVSDVQQIYANFGISF